MEGWCQSWGSAQGAGGHSEMDAEGRSQDLGHKEEWWVGTPATCQDLALSFSEGAMPVPSLSPGVEHMPMGGPAFCPQVYVLFLLEARSTLQPLGIHGPLCAHCHHLSLFPGSQALQSELLLQSL